MSLLHIYTANTCSMVYPYVMASPQQSRRKTNNKQAVLGDLINLVEEIKGYIERIGDWLKNLLKPLDSNIPITKETSSDLPKIGAFNANQENTGALNNSNSQDHLTVETQDDNEQNVLVRCKECLQQMLGDCRTCFDMYQGERKNQGQDTGKESKLVEEDNTTGKKSSMTTIPTKGEYEPSRWWNLWNNIRKFLESLANLSCVRTQKEVDSQLYCPNPSDLLKSAMDKLHANLKERLNAQDIKLNMTIYQPEQEFNKDTQLIVVCLLSSRAGTDVRNAMKGIKTRSGVAVLIIHNVMKHALPSVKSSKILTAPEYEKIDTIVDMGFLSDEGIYPCNFNEEALNDLTMFIKTERAKE